MVFKSREKYALRQKILSTRTKSYSEFMEFVDARGESISSLERRFGVQDPLDEEYVFPLKINGLLKYISERELKRILKHWKSAGLIYT